MIRFIYKELYKGEPLALPDVYRLLDDNPEVALINRDVKVKGNVKYGAGLLNAPKYAIVQSGGEYFILDKNKEKVSLEAFLADMKMMFPGKGL